MKSINYYYDDDMNICQFIYLYWRSEQYLLTFIYTTSCYPQAIYNLGVIKCNIHIFPIDPEGNIIVLPDDAFGVACVAISQAAASVYPTSGRGAKPAHYGVIQDCPAAELTYL